MNRKKDIAPVLKIQYPLLQGPFGGGLSSSRLVAAVSNAGGLGGYGAYQLEPLQIKQVVKEIRALTNKPFNINLWVNDADANASDLNDVEFEHVAASFKPYFDELNIPLPSKPQNAASKFEKQVEVLLSLQPAVFSFVFGIPSREILNECRKRQITTIGAATTLDEAMALEDAGVDLIVASGFEAGGHRPSFIQTPELSLHGTFTLVHQLSSKVKAPVIAAGGIVDARSIKAAFKLGASGVQIGTAFLACEESGASNEYREVLFSDRAKYTSLTNVFTGRLARGISGRIGNDLRDVAEVLPFPLQSVFLSPLRKAAIEQGRMEMLTFWAGQNALSVKHKTVQLLFKSIIEDMQW
ncbi:nitronate monooxygenase [Lacibacter cauensis]|uniref:Propionate 3-nitronate monooxygenase n=2 Tax=Lacibacter cauensis TaxID=510947 RepID=A0A562SYM1_9BACT|nr:nitronate monooxygenase [Lacibacter cauensis]